MAKKTISIDVEQSAYDFCEATVAVVNAIRAAKAQGVAAEAEAGVLAAVANYSSIIGELQNVKADLLEDHTAFYRGFLNGALDIGTAALA